jgi:hypothetical protein
MIDIKTKEKFNTLKYQEKHVPLASQYMERYISDITV